eukprot:1627780-Amphidinium_carterae.1
MAARKPQAGIFLACNICCGRTPLKQLEANALQSGYPLFTILKMYAGRRHVLIQGQTRVG